jgi:hypothetical protein
MERLRNKFLNVEVDAVLHPASDSAQQAATEQKDKATMALGDEQRKPGDRRPSQLPETQTTTLDRIRHSGWITPMAIATVALGTVVAIVWYAVGPRLSSPTSLPTVGTTSVPSRPAAATPSTAPVNGCVDVPFTDMSKIPPVMTTKRICE